MSGKIKKRPTGLRKKAARGFRGYPAATIAFYGPDDERASKVAVGIIPEEDAPVDALERWFSNDRDIRYDPVVAEKILAFVELHGAKSIMMTDGILGCPHEEGIDYPEDTACPKCPFWDGRDRWARDWAQT